MKKTIVKKNLNEKINSLFNSYLTIDSREILNKDKLSCITSEEIQVHIETLNNTKQIKHSFFHNTYIKEILTYVNRPLKFYNCIFDINILEQTDFNFLHFHSFKKCTIYCTSTFLNIKELNIIKNLITNNSFNGIKIINKPYAYSLLEQQKINNENFNMLSINNSDLSALKIPNDKNFFKILDKNTIENVKFPELNLEHYDIKNIHFINCEFTSNSKIPHNALNYNFRNCTLPIINFKSDFNYKIYSCKINKNSTFPKDKNFFIKSSFKECIMPKKDYSFYKIDKFSFEKCYFDKDAILPNDIFKQENSNILLTLSNIPDNHIGKIAQYTYVKEKNTFLNKYNHLLSIEERFLLENLNF